MRLKILIVAGVFVLSGSVGVMAQGGADATGVTGVTPPAAEPDTALITLVPDSALRIEDLLAKAEANPSQADTWTQLGILYAEEGLNEVARDAFISALQAAPTEPLSHLNLGNILMKMERWSEALTPLGSYRRMAPDDVRGHALAGIALEGNGDLAGARQAWLDGSHQVGMPMPDRIALLSELTRTYLEDEGVTEDQLIEMATTLEAEPAVLADVGGSVLNEQREFAWLETARIANEDQRPDDALERWQHLREIGCHNDSPWLQAAQLLIDLDRLDDADVLVSQARSVRESSAMAEYLAGRVAEQRRDFRTAARAYGAAASADPTFPGVHSAHGEALAAIGDNKAAARAFARAVRGGGGDAVASYNMGVILNKEDRFAEAIPHLEKAVRLDAENRDAHRALGTAYRKTSRFSDSAKTYQLIVDTFGPDSRDLYQLAYAQAKSNDHKNAAKNYEMVTVLESSHRLAHYGLGNSLLKINNFERAAEAFSSALALKPDFYGASYNLALSYQKMGDDERAIEQYELTLELRETYAVLVNMAICYLNLGDEESSDEYYAMAAELKKGGK